MLLYLQMKVGAPLAPPLLQTLLTLVCNKFISTYWNINACCIMPCRDIVSFLKSTCTGQNSQGLHVTINVWFWAVFFCFTRFSFETRISLSQIILSYLLHRSYLILLCCLCVLPGWSEITTTSCTALRFMVSRLLSNSFSPPSVILSCITSPIFSSTHSILPVGGSLA